MPLYEYVCAGCQSRFEKLQTTAESGQAQCPRCGSGQATLQFSIFAAGGRKDRGSSSAGGGCGCGSACGCKN